MNLMEMQTLFPDFLYERAEHRSIATDYYVFHQLIPYIGNKRKLLPLIYQAISRTNIQAPASFLDAFSGSGVVARMAKQLGFRVLANDWEPYAESINHSAIGCNEAPSFYRLGGYEQAIVKLNSLETKIDWVTRHLCPSDDLHYDTATDRLFYTRANGMKIDTIRCQIERWSHDGVINETEQACLLAPLLYMACYVSNTSGVFKGFHNGWGGKTGTAHYRILSDLTLSPVVFHDNGLENRVYRQDALLLAEQLRQQKEAVDIAYLDPPYNQHPYASNYHVLNSIALWDKPALTEKITGNNKAAIRLDWRKDRRSGYNYRKSAETAYEQLINTLDTRVILTSYSTDGLIPLHAMLRICTERGKTDVVMQNYKRYRVSSQRFSHKPLNIEFVLIVDTTEQHNGSSVDELAATIYQAENAAMQSHPEGVSGNIPRG